MSADVGRRTFLAAGACGVAAGLALVETGRSQPGSDFEGRLTHWPLEIYPNAKLPVAVTGTVFNSTNARAMAWAVQLAYEVGKTPAEQAQVKTILGNWQWTLIGTCNGTAPGNESTKTARAFVAEADSVKVLAFSGTEPTRWSDWLADFNISPCGKDGIHEGFANYADSVRHDVEAYLGVRAGVPGRDLFIAGHSLGGAVAAVTALRLVQANMIDRGRVHVFTFGMPRTGTALFARTYRAAGLGMNTCRFVHGVDLVPKIPPRILTFRHVGQHVACGSNGQFDLQNIAPDELEAPTMIDEYQMSHGVLTNLSGVPKCPKTPKFPGTTDVEQLPCAIRDHLPDGYLRALGESVTPTQ